MDPITILAALLPLGIDAGKYAIQKWLAPESVKPGTFAELLQLRQLDIEQFKAMLSEACSAPCSRPACLACGCGRPGEAATSARRSPT